MFILICVSLFSHFSKSLFLVLVLITAFAILASINYQLSYEGTFNNRILNSKINIKVRTILNDTKNWVIGNALIGSSTEGKERTRGIPKIIHQIWNDDFIPAAFHDNIKGLTAHNKPPEWKYYFWTIATGNKFIKDKFPNLMQRYSAAGEFNLFSCNQHQ